MIDGDTICLNCGTAEKFHCGAHALRCCPKKCPGETGLKQRFHPPQPAVMKVDPEGNPVVDRPADLGWSR